MSNALTLISADIQGARDQFATVLADKSISFEREAGFAIQVLGNSDYAMKAAMNNRQAVVDAVTNIAAIGISLNPAKKQAYLVPRGNKICLDISYMGLLDLAIASGSIKWGQAEMVYSNDRFSLQGFGNMPIHDREPFGTDRGDLLGVYVVVKTHDGDYLTATMTIAEVNAIKERSEAGKKGSGPWRTDFNEMAKKTVIRRAYKTWPKTERMDKAIDYLNTDGGQGINFQAEQRGADWVNVEPMIAEAKRTRTDADALAYWKANCAKLKDQPGDFKRLKEAISRHRAELQKGGDVIENGDAGTQRQASPAGDAPDADFVAGLDRGAQQQDGYPGQE